MPGLGFGMEPMPFRPAYWARGRRDGSGGGQGARRLPGPSSIPPPLLMTPHPQLPGAPSELGKLTGPQRTPPPPHHHHRLA